ncbi:hypothetical protein N7447_006193 [Penicillium robsamsonii]|uniref:uncharacterized protein n=1 Tax=Penicillium robsamsonii TaxID=1792511 RepID=UPI0025466CCF|nr:uncharacterized protein N7447_006193 [Penicillium robsamsonii]KAJ5823853.1 hypothetical protein N7447_006193 [Penicillium robsamsonii]
MYMCSNTGLSGWAELRNRTRLNSYGYCPSVAGQRLHVTSRVQLSTGRLAFSSAHVPASSPRFVNSSKHVQQHNTCLKSSNKNYTAGT